MKKIIIILFCFLFCTSMKIVNRNSCINISNFEMSKLQAGDTFDRFSENFDIEQNCWTSQEIYNDQWFKIEIPLLEHNVKVTITFKYDKIEKMECQAGNIRIDCSEIEHPNLKAAKNRQILQQYMEKVR